MKLLKRKFLIELSLTEAELRYPELLSEFPSEVRGELVRFLVDEDVWAKLNSELPEETVCDKDRWYKVIPVVAADQPDKSGSRCYRCCFSDADEYDCGDIPCLAKDRSDGRAVYFKHKTRVMA